MPDKITDEQTTDEQTTATEPDQPADADETNQEPETAEQPTAEEVAAAVAAIEEDSDDSDEDDDADTDEDADDDATDGDAAWRRKLRRKNREAQKLRTRAVNAETELAKYKVAAQTGLPPELAARLQGTTEEELTADAEKLMALVGKKHRIPGAPPATGDRQGSFRATPETETDLGKIGSRIYER